MNEPTIQQQNYYPSGEVDLQAICRILWVERWLILGFTATAAAISIVVSLMATEIYRAEAVLVPAESEQSGGSLVSQFGGAAALLGVNLNSGGDVNINTAISTLRSRQFIGRFVHDNNLLVSLFAGNWDKRTQENLIDQKIYNSATNEWVRAKGMPTSQETFRKFNEILTVSGPDRNTGVVMVAINWHNPIEASLWVNQLVAALNQEVRTRDVQEANSAVDYLRQQLQATQLVDMQRIFYQLIESQTRIIMLADVRNEYVFRIIDPAVVPDQKIEPRRLVIVMLGIVFGVSLAFMIIFFRYYMNSMKESIK